VGIALVFLIDAHESEELDVSNPQYAPGPDPTASAPEGAPFSSPYATGQTTSSETYEDQPSQPADVSYGSVEQPPTPDGSGDQSKVDVAKDEAAAVKDTAVDAGKDVAATARDEAANVAAEARYQAKSLLATASDEVRSQASTQQTRLAQAVHSLSKELGGMASSSPESGPLTDLAHQAARKGGDIAHWLENREPADVLDEVRAFARRRPIMFLGLCALAGIVAGRLTRGAVAANTSLDSKTDESPRRLSSAGSYGTATASYSAQADYPGSAQAATGDYAPEVPRRGYPTGTDYPNSGQAAAGSYPAESGYADQQGRDAESAPTPPTTGAAGGMPSSGSGYAEEESRQQPYGGESNR
jgi:hypothetical protein